MEFERLAFGSLRKITEPNASVSDDEDINVPCASQTFSAWARWSP